MAFGANSSISGQTFFLSFFSWNAPVIGVHCAMQSNGGFTSLVNIGDGFNEISVFLVSEAMAV